VKNRRVSSEKIYDGRIVRLRIDTVELPNGELAKREVIEHPGAAAIVPLDENGQVHLVRQYRDAVGEELLELPAGKLNSGEDPLDCARRELREELGLEAGSLALLSSFYSTPGFSDEVMHLYLAEELSHVTAQMDSDEFITAEKRSIFPLDKLIAELRDAKTIVGIMLASELMVRTRESRNEPAGE
jgi:ADP-ribose pyrophosphatase